MRWKTEKNTSEEEDIQNTRKEETEKDIKKKKEKEEPFFKEFTFDGFNNDEEELLDTEEVIKQARIAVRSSDRLRRRG